METERPSKRGSATDRSRKEGLEGKLTSKKAPVDFSRHPAPLPNSQHIPMQKTDKGLEAQGWGVEG